MRKSRVSNAELPKKGKFYSRLYRWNADREFSFDECELLYDLSGRLVGVDYRRDNRKPTQLP